MENQITRDNLMVLEIRELLEKARKTVAQQVRLVGPGAEAAD